MTITLRTTKLHSKVYPIKSNGQILQSIGKVGNIINEFIKRNDINQDVETFEKIFLAIAENTLVKQNTKGKQKAHPKTPE